MQDETSEFTTYERDLKKYQETRVFMGIGYKAIGTGIYFPFSMLLLSGMLGSLFIGVRELKNLGSYDFTQFPEQQPQISN